MEDISLNLRGIRAEEGARMRACSCGSRAASEPCGKMRGVIITKHNNVCNHATV